MERLAIGVGERSSTSTPSGRSVGSSTTSRPAVTRALIVMPLGYHSTRGNATASASRRSSFAPVEGWDPLVEI